jgi:hypothetical protein
MFVLGNTILTAGSSAQLASFQGHIYTSGNSIHHSLKINSGAKLKHVELQKDIKRVLTKLDISHDIWDTFESLYRE